MKIYAKNNYSILLYLLAVLSLSGCYTLDSAKNWPQDIPDRSIFIDAYKKQVAAGANNEPLERHLLWIKRFYKGSAIYPIGWNDMIEQVVNSLENADEQTLAKKRLEDLGLKIVIEWAQENSSRNIDSSNISIWGNALKTSVEQNEQFAFMDKVELDVENLIARKLNPTQITQERYYPPEDDDNF